MINPIERCYRELIQQGKEVLKLFSGNPCDEGFFFPKEILNKAYQKYFETLHYQPHSKGLPQARQGISGFYARSGLEINPEHLLLTSGSSESFHYLFTLLTHPEDNILTPNPAYPLFDTIAQMSRIELRHYPLLENQNWEVDIEALKNLTDEKTRAIVLVSPNNPTGSVISAEQIREIVEWANEKNIALICDEVFSEFYFHPPSSDELNHFPRPAQVAKPNLCFTLNGISKMFALPSLKLSWILVTGENKKVEQAVDQLETLADTFLSCHTPIQQALPVLFSEGWSFVQDYVAEVARRRTILISLLEEIPNLRFNSPQGAFYCLVDFSNTVKAQQIGDEEEFVIALMKETKVFIHPGYFYDYEIGVHGVISFLCSPDKLKVGLGKLKVFLS
ncbi:MAG: pyridoxal phosphate-dependent aminotransferase [Deltaproteobacteria bacterium]|nr:pyridoxal phosphate-dependent aminotransferase [Deltaproteobacteria bacterium]